MTPDCHECAQSYMHADYLTRARVLICGHYNVPATPKTAQDCTEYIPREPLKYPGDAR